MVVEKRYFLLYRDGVCKAKAMCNLQAMIDKWLQDINAKEVTREEYEVTKPVVD